MMDHNIGYAEGKIMAARKLYQTRLPLIGMLVAVRLILCSDDAMFPGQARPDDPHACVWFESLTGTTVFRCCDGYFKTEESNLTENCIECPVGSYGRHCKNDCICENGGTCNKVDGSCHCSAQYFGKTCQFLCNCENGASCMSGGSCSCANGFYGDLCVNQCVCPVNSECDSKTGECICLSGFYGKSCLPCNCSNNEKCDQNNGLCSCMPGYYGEKCDKQCSCFNGAYCDIDHLDMCTCAFGWVGSNCTDCDSGKRKSDGILYCEDKCLHCYNGHTCSVQNGDCECSTGWQGNRCDKCDVGFYGFNCSEICNSHCEQSSCNHVDGSCQCENGWTGQRCEVPCPRHCVLCNENFCTSCKTGWTGKKCTEICDAGFYGNGCKQTCQECNCDLSCNHISGNCDDVVRCGEQKCKYPNAKICMENPFKLECQDGWNGRLCDVKTDNGINMADRQNSTASPMRDGDISTLSLVIIITVVVSVCLGIAFGIMKFRMRRTAHRNARCSEPEEGTSTKEKEIYHHASGRKSKRVTHQSDAIEKDNREVELYTLIQGPEEKSTSEKDTIVAPPYEGAYEIVPFEKSTSNTDINDQDTAYDMLDGLRYAKEYKYSNVSGGAYELLNHPLATGVLEQ